MSYKLTITRSVPNPKFDAERALRRSRGGDYFIGEHDPSVYEPMLVERVLDVEITDAEFIAVKRAVLEAM